MLELASDLRLPPEAALQRFGILAMSGAGKSNTAVVMGEEMYDAGIPWVAVDPKGDWWGIRSSRNGKGDGLAVPVFGGLHGDLPLEPTAGKLLAEVIAAERLTCVLDVSEFNSKADQLRFLTDLAETLLRKNRDPLHVFCEEADEYLPQRVFKNEARCVGAWSRLVKRGRFRGIFCTLITQRSASLSKDALNQIDTLIPMRTTAPRDRKAIEDWVLTHDLGRELLDSLTSLEDGEAWVWSPQKLKLEKKVAFRRRRTFDSGETPTLGKGRRAAKLADVDLDSIEGRMAETIEKAKQDDPAELRKRIRQLESERDGRDRGELEVVRKYGEPGEGLIQIVERLAAQPDVEYKEIPIFEEGLRDDLEELLIRIRENASKISVSCDLTEEKLEEARKLAGVDAAQERTRERDLSYTPPKPDTSPLVSTPRPSTSSPVSGEGLPKAARKMLETLVQRSPMKLTRAQLATLSGYSIKSSTVPNSLTALRAAGAIEEDGTLFWPSEKGFATIGEVPPAPSPEQLIATWRSALPGGAPQAFFDLLVKEHPRKLERGELAHIAGYSPSSSTVPNTLTTLRRNGLLDEQDGLIGVSEWLFA